MASRHEKDVSRCEEKLRVLFMQQHEQATIENLESLLGQQTQLKQLLDQQLLIQANETLVAEIAEASNEYCIPGTLQQHLKNSADPDKLLSRIKSNLGLDHDIAADIELTTAQYNVAICRSTGEHILGRLPRELRDMVGSFVVPEEVVLCIVENCGGGLLYAFDYNCDPDCEFSHIQDIGQPYFFTSPRTQDDNICPQHFWRDGVIGTDNARELIENFYRTSTFRINGYAHTSFDTKRSAYVLSNFLQNDRFALGHQPSSLISHIKFDLELLAHEEQVDFRDQAKVAQA